MCFGVLREVRSVLLVSKAVPPGWDGLAGGTLAGCSWPPWAAKQLGGTQ